MMDHDGMNNSVIYLKPGEMYFGETPGTVTTVLGSCIAIVMHNRRLRLGAICHAMLPDGICDEGGLRYLNCALTEMLDRFLARGVGCAEIEVKLFGGGDVLMPAGGGTRGKTVGRQNIETAMELIEREGLKLVSYDLGGPSGRKILFRTDTGEVLVKRLRKDSDE